MEHELLKSVKKDYPMVRTVPIVPSDLVFEERVRMNCFYCGKYSNNWKCPPQIPPLNYQKLISEYTSGLFVYLSMDYGEYSYGEVRRDSSVVLHKALLLMEKKLFQCNNVMALSFIGGSCKLCKDGCGKENCRNPYQARTPVEAIGVNVMESARKYNIVIDFTLKNKITRIGLLLY